MSAWQDLVTASLIGTERAAVPAVPIPSAPARPRLPRIAHFRNVRCRMPRPTRRPLLLDRAALLTAARRGGRRPERAEPLTAAEPDTAPAVSRAAGRRLARMLSGEHADLLAEWLAAVADRGRRVPARLLPALLHQARRGSPADCRAAPPGRGGGRPPGALAGRAQPGVEVRPGLRPGRRGRVAAGRRRRSAAATCPRSAPGTLAPRGTWSRRAGTRPARTSASCSSACIADGLSLADEPLLDGALDDRHARVRQAAADLLAALPGSALAGRMAEPGRDCLRLNRGIRGVRSGRQPARRMRRRHAA